MCGRRTELVVGDSSALSMGEGCDDEAVLSVLWRKVFDEDLQQELQNYGGFPSTSASYKQACLLGPSVHGHRVGLFVDSYIKRRAKPLTHCLLFFS